MGSRGPAPKPRALKKLQGNPGRRKLNDAEPTPDAALPACPAWLNTEAKREWKRVAATLHVAGLLTSVDMAVLAGYCQSYARWRKAELQVERQDQVVVSDKGGSYLNPWLIAAQIALKDMSKLASQLGMTPSARTTIKVPLQKKEKSLAEILFEQAQQK
jgi:P27 family predicted phage terminase small subunit